MDKAAVIKNKGYWVAKIQLDLYNHVEEYMNKNHINRSQLAERLGVTKGYITQVLNGDYNHSISKLVELSLAIGKIPEIRFKDLESMTKDLQEDHKYLPRGVKARKTRSSQSLFKR